MPPAWRKDRMPGGKGGGKPPGLMLHAQILASNPFVLGDLIATPFSA
jgi:hypothetical protein